MKFLAVIALSLLLTACGGGIQGKKHLDMNPKFDIKEFFDGNIEGWGIIQDRSGNVIKQFDVVIDAKWNGNKGILEEVFDYYDKEEPEYRTWHITKIDDETYIGTAGDIIDQADGKQFGNALNWVYDMNVPVGDKTYRLTFDDWMWAMQDGVIINRSYMKKFGIIVAELTLFMKKK